MHYIYILYICTIYISVKIKNITYIHLYIYICYILIPLINIFFFFFLKPKDFDEDSTIVVCNFPQKTTISECKNFMQWIGPVIKVEKIPSFMQENNYLVVFCNPYFAKVIIRY